jgi:hypothetical protein
MLFPLPRPRNSLPFSRAQSLPINRATPTAHPHVDHNLRPQRAPNILLAPLPPIRRATLTQRPQHQVLPPTPAHNDVPKLRRRHRRQRIQLPLQLGTVAIERQIVDIVAERVLELVPDGREPDDDVCRGQGAGDGDPAQRVEELEGEQVDVEEHDLGDQDVVADGEGRGEDALGRGLGVGERCERGHYTQSQPIQTPEILTAHPSRKEDGGGLGEDLLICP